MKQIFTLDSNKIKKIDIKKIYDSKYKRLANNLLDIKSKGDYATFFKLSNINCDLKKIIGIKNLRELFNTNTFKIQLKNSLEKQNILELESIKSISGFKI